MVDSSTNNTSPKSKPLTFQTTLLQTGKNITGIEVPEPVMDELGGGKRPLVKVKVNTYSYRSAVAVMDGKSMISMSAAHRETGGFHGGDPVTVTLELDTEPRTVEIPEDLKSALTAANTMAEFEKSAPSMKKEYVRWVEDAKTPETRERRIAKTVEKLKGI